MSVSKWIQTGADQLLARQNELFAGERFGLLTNPTGIDSSFNSTIDICAHLTKSRLSAMFACEHGIRGEKQAGVLCADEVDPELQIPVYSLYSENRKPTPAMMDGLDTLVVDIQDLGIRFYTYQTTLTRVIEACAEQGKRLIVLDRPNPLGGIVCEGGLMRPDFISTIGAAEIPIRSGLTFGEYAKFINGQWGNRCDLQVVPLTGWKRDMQYPDTGLPWVMPSPNMPTINTVRVYPGNCLFEGTTLSEGRGTTKPFELIGAPWMDGKRVSREMNGIGLPGVHFLPVYFTPVFSKWQGELCGGVECYVTDPEAYRPVRTALYLLNRLQVMYPQLFAWRPKGPRSAHAFIDLLTGSDQVRTQTQDTHTLEALLRAWEEEAAAWDKARQPYFIYGMDDHHGTC